MKNSKIGVCKNNKTNKETTFNYWTDLNIESKMRFVNGVTDTLIGDNYYSFLTDLIFDFKIIEIFTDYDLSEIIESKNIIAMIEDLLESTNIVEIVKANAKNGLIDELRYAVEDNIEYRTGVHRNSISRSVIHLINSIENKMDEINAEDILSLSKSLKGMTGEVTADKIIEAYANSPIFLKTLKDRQKEHDERFAQIANNVSLKNRK